MTVPLRGRPALLGLVAGLVAARLAWRPGEAICRQTTMVGCLGVAVLVVAALGLVAFTARAAWLAVGAHREVAALPVVPPPARLVAAARRAGLGEVACLDSPASSAFCAGLARPRVFVTSGMVATLGEAELDAVLVHEAEHARRRDPARRLAARAAAEVLFWLPLVGWWSKGRLEAADLAADRAAIQRVGRRSLARALRATAAPPAPAAAGVRFDGAGSARVAQLLGDQPPTRRPPLAACALSLLGLVVAVSLAMCVGQGLAGAVAAEPRAQPVAGRNHADYYTMIVSTIER
jgi:Zn-dependent protease with chaperone function